MLSSSEVAAHSSQRAPAVALAIAVAAGLCASREFPGWFSVWWMAALVSGVIWVALHLVGLRRLSAIGLMIGWLSLAAAWHDFCRSSIAPCDISRVATDDGVSIRLVAKVREPVWIVEAPADSTTPTWRESRRRTLTTCDCRELVTPDRRMAIDGRIRLNLYDEYPDLTCGDVIAVVGKLRLPASPLNAGDFDFRTWLQAQGVSSVLQVESIEAIRQTARESTPGDVWGRMRRALRQRAQNLFAASLSPENAGVAETLLLGGRRRFDDDLRQAFAESGMLHVLAISGVNVALLGWWLTILVRLAGGTARHCFWIVLGGLVFYAAVTDGDPPVIRATVMVLLGGAALWSARHVSGVQIVALTLLGMMLVNPADLFHAGAQLSFLSVLTIGRTLAAWQARQRDLVPIAVGKSAWPEWLSSAGKLWWEGTLVSIGIWFATTPLVAWRFQLISPVGLLLNIVLGPLIVVLMWSGYSFLMVGMIVPAAAAPLALLFDGCLWSLIRSVEWASSAPFGHFDVASPPDWWMVGYYLGVGVLLLGGDRMLMHRLALRGLLAWTVIGLTAGLMPAGRNGLSCQFLAVGHGLSVLMELPDGQVVLYDAGSMGDSQRAARVIQQAMLRRGHRRLDAVIVSHADADHCNALPNLLGTIPIGTVLIGPGFLDGDQPLPFQIVERCSRHKAAVGLLAAGHQLALHPDVEIRVLHPSEDFYADTDNPLSLVTAVEYRGRRVLLTGDVEKSGLSELLHSPAWSCDVLLSPHHGSRTANPRELAGWAKPRWVVVSTSDRDAERRLMETYDGTADVLSTATRGTVGFQIDPEGEMTVETFRGE